MLQYTHCNYRKQYQGANRTQFEKESGETVCKCCGVLAVHIPCPAKKVWEFPRNSNYVTVIHSGKHTCVPKPKQDSSKLKEAFLENPNLRPRQAAFQYAVNALKTGKSWEEVVEVTDRFINTNKVKNVKQKVRQDMHPSGFNFEAVGELKGRVTKRDPYYIYSVNDRKLNGQASYVFKMSKIQANLALSMDRDGDGILHGEYCFLDVKHNRCAGFKTFSIHVYHPMLRRLVTLATMECEDETTKTLTKFWLLFNEVLAKVSGDNKKMFNPTGWMADEAGANWAAICSVYGKESFNRTVGCQFHFKQSVNHHANQLGSSKSTVQLKKLSNDLMQATTPSLYKKCVEALKDFICKKPNRRNFLNTWLEWWHHRRFHIFKAFRATNNTPSTNLAEAVHATWKCTQATNITLVDAAYYDIAESIHIERQLEQYKSGLYQGGSGPSAYSRQQQNYQSQKKRAEQYSAELLKDSATDQTTYPLDPECSHRPTKRKRTAKRNSSKKSRLSVHLQTELSSSSSEESVHSPPKHDGKTKRNFRYRSQRSKSFELSLQKAKRLKNTILLTQTIDLCEAVLCY